MATQLTRKAVDVKTLQEVTDEKFVKEAKQLLGYAVLEDALALRKVAEILDKLEIEPFTNERVEAYKKEHADAQFARKRHTTRSGYTVTQTTRGEWQTSDLHGYKREIPGFALLRAAAIQKEMNKQKVSGYFEVDELHLKTTRTRHVPRVVDPFMVLVVGTTRLFIDVWNEPKFEGRRTK